MNNKFNFYEKVIIHSPLKKHKKINGKGGVVLGMSHDGKEHFYSVSIETQGICWVICEKYLIGTGIFIEKSEIYDGSCIKVTTKQRK